MADLASLVQERYPRSSSFDLRWQVSRCMGPNPLWLVEDLLGEVELRPGMRILDLGCGLGMTTTFLVRQYGVQVVAVDHWVAAEEIQWRLEEDGVAVSAEAVNAEAHALPFDTESFDAVISVDAYHYFGTSDLYIGYISQFLKPGGVLAVASPGAVVEWRDLGGLPRHIRELAGWEALSFHTPAWWRFLWEQSGQVTVSSVRGQETGWSDWLLWCEVCAEHSQDEAVRAGSRACIEPLQYDTGSRFTFVLLVARKQGASG
jgi:SAM-dependent methyltransferase